MGPAALAGSWCAARRKIPGLGRSRSDPADLVGVGRFCFLNDGPSAPARPIRSTDDAQAELRRERPMISMLVATGIFAAAAAGTPATGGPLWPIEIHSLGKVIRTEAA